MDINPAQLQQTLGGLKLAELQALASKLSINCTGIARHKATFVGPLAQYMLANKDVLVHDPAYQAYFVGGAGALPKARTTSDDKAQQDAVAAADKHANLTPAYQGIMARKLTSDPPGRQPLSGPKKVTFSGPEGTTPPVTPKPPKKPARKTQDQSDSEIEPVETPKRVPPQVQQASAHVKVLIHNLGPGLEEVIVPLSEGVRREEAVTSGDGSSYYIQLDDVLTSMTKNEVASPLKGRAGRLKAFTPTDEGMQPRTLRDLGSVDKILAGDVSRLTGLTAMNQHAVVKRAGPTGAPEFELNIFYMPGEAAPSGGMTATGVLAPGGSTLPPAPTGTTGPTGTMPPSAPTTAVPPKKAQLDNSAEFHAGLAAYLTSKGVPPWTGRLAEVMKQRLERFLHVGKAMDIIGGWRTSLRNSSYDVPADFQDDAFPDYWRWLGGHFTISAIRTALGLKHTTASDDLACFNIPEKLSDDVRERLQPLIDWIKNPEDEALLEQFGSMSLTEFKRWRKDAFTGESDKKGKTRAKDRNDKEKKKKSRKGKEKEKEKESSKGKRHRNRDDSDDSSRERKKRKRKTSENLDDESDSN